MEQKKKTAALIREEKKKQLLKFIERKKTRVIPLEKRRGPLQEMKKELSPVVNKENVPKETEKSYIEGSNRRKKRREKLQEIKEKRDEIKKKRALAIQERKKEKEERKKRAKEEKQRKKLEALKKREEARQLREAKKKEAIEKRKEELRKREEARLLQEAKKREETEKKRAEALRKQEEARQLKEAKKKEDLLALINKIKEKHQLEYNQRLLQKQVALAERKVKEERAKEEKQRKKLEALKKREEARQLREAKKKEELLLKEKKTVPAKKIIPPEGEEIPSVGSAVITPQIKRKEELLEFLRTRKVLYQQESERKKILRQISIEKKKEAEVPVKKAVKVAEGVLPSAIIAKISGLSKEASRIEKDAKGSVSISSGNIKHFISTFTRKKKVEVKKPVPAVPEKRPIAKYKEPFLLMPFIRRNIFKFVFLILLIIWLFEISFFMGRLQDPQKRLSDIVGEDISKKRPAAAPAPKEEKLPVTETEFKIALKKEKVEIEGKRDPFSPGYLTMEVFEKPEVTSIVLASKPDIISISRPSKVVSILREEKQMVPEKVSPISKPQTPSYQPILKDRAPSTVQPVEKAKPAEISALIMPEKRCDLIYRGRLVIDGVEYLFIEGKNKTYRVTIGDVVEGFRILRKEKDKLYLSREGIIYEIPVD